ncbi:hypothetical protein PR003_g13884 [Phytophthora rubi]|uniref:Secreted protein n=1 Tax=Phytophthora rubi TaxID=129364 RepID=A0A6A3LSL0_9STRA|nr:hypothetical protein PR001_g13113 [Phytophthora rubi]KAE9333714.1 hypothetical protein PR003_g13884 [Phytophthora rubi]
MQSLTSASTSKACAACLLCLVFQRQSSRVATIAATTSKRCQSCYFDYHSPVSIMTCQAVRPVDKQLMPHIPVHG